MASAITVTETEEEHGGTVLEITSVDISRDTVSPEQLLEGVTAHDAAGNQIVGIAKRGDDIDPLGNNSSILRTIRRMLGPSEEYNYFDTDLVININAAFSRLCQLGVGPTFPFHITGEDECWCDFMDAGYMEDIKQYIYLSTKVIFDPPSSSTVLSLYKEQIDKLEWLLKETAEFGY